MPSSPHGNGVATQPNSSFANMQSVKPSKWRKVGAGLLGGVGVLAWGALSVLTLGLCNVGVAVAALAYVGVTTVAPITLGTTALAAVATTSADCAINNGKDGAPKGLFRRCWEGVKSCFGKKPEAASHHNQTAQIQAGGDVTLLQGATIHNHHHYPQPQPTPQVALYEANDNEVRTPKQSGAVSSAVAASYQPNPGLTYRPSRRPAPSGESNGVYAAPLSPVPFNHHLLRTSSRSVQRGQTSARKTAPASAMFSPFPAYYVPASMAKGSKEQGSKSKDTSFLSPRVQLKDGWGTQQESHVTHAGTLFGNSPVKRPLSPPDKVAYRNKTQTEQVNQERRYYDAMSACTRSIQRLCLLTGYDVVLRKKNESGKIIRNRARKYLKENFSDPYSLCAFYMTDMQALDSMNNLLGYVQYYFSESLMEPTPTNWSPMNIDARIRNFEAITNVLNALSTTILQDNKEALRKSIRISLGLASQNLCETAKYAFIIYKNESSDIIPGFIEGEHRQSLCI